MEETVRETSGGGGTISEKTRTELKKYDIEEDSYTQRRRGGGKKEVSHISR